MKQTFAELCQLTRENKNICPTCNLPKTMYYKPWCPRCEKPEFESIKVLNLMQCLKHMEALDILRKDDVWSTLIKRFEFSNDTYFSFNVIKKEDRKYIDKEFLPIYDAFIKTFNIKENILFFVSW